MQVLAHFLERAIVTGSVTRGNVQPARIPVFVSAWWHLQEPERWPLYSWDVRQALERASEETQDPIEAYFVFRERFLAVAGMLGLSGWEFEHLCRWYEGRSSHGSPQERSRCGLLPTVEEQNRTHLRWLLAKIGAKVGCRVWIAAEAWQQEWQQERLGDVSMDSLSFLVGQQRRQCVQQLDVLWVQKNEIVAAYKIVSTPEEMVSSLLAISDVGLLFQKRNISLWIVAAGNAGALMKGELARPTFQKHGMRTSCGFLASEALIAHEEHILRWAHTLSVLVDFKTYVGALA